HTSATPIADRKNFGITPTNPNPTENHMSPQITPKSLAFFAGKIACAILVPLLCAATMARAQDAIRPSLAGEASAEARRQSIDKIPYNLQVGPIKFRFSATMGVEYNDNVNLAEDGSIVVLTPTG